ncbi:MAG: aminopeptidase P family protein [Chloroflexi bacterium]|nr:aminopeptidase P family protein [Chloroflexota bacterium]
MAELMAQAGVGALLVHGNVAARQDVQYVCGFPPRHDTYACLTERGDALFVQLFNHVANAREMSAWSDVRWGGIDTGATLARHLAALALERERIGLVGQIPYQQRDRLDTLLPGAAFTDLTPAFRRHRLVKSPEEIEWTRRGAALCDLALEALLAAVRPGTTDQELGALVEAAYSRAGGHHTICFLGSASMADGGRVSPAQNWADRLVRAGDIVFIELSAGYGGYTGQVLRTIAVGAQPTPLIQRLHDVAEAAYTAIVAAIRPGATANELLEAAALIDEAGFTVCDDVVHGYQGGYLPPIIRTPATQHAPLGDLRLEPGMMLVVQPNVVSRDGRHGVQPGQLVLVTLTGAEPLHRVPLRLFVRP